MKALKIWSLCLGVLLIACQAPRPTPVPLLAAASVTPSSTSNLSLTLVATSTSTPAPTLKPSPIPSPTLTARATVSLTPAPGGALWSCFKNAASVAPSYFKAIVVEADRLRREWQKNPFYQHRVDPKLNECRVNILLFGFGETHEPGGLDWGIIGSPTLVSYDLRRHQLDLVSLTHDIWSPEVRQLLRPDRHGLDPQMAERISEAYFVGNFSLMKMVLENATGLSVDFQIAFKDTLIRDLVAEVFDDQLPVHLPESFVTYPFWMEKILYPSDRTQVIRYEKGIQVFRGLDLVGLIKTVPVPNAQGEYPNRIEHNRRKEWVLEALAANARQKGQSPDFWLRTAAFLWRKWLESQVDWSDRRERQLDFDFEPATLSAQIMAEIWEGYRRGDSLSLPAFGSKIYVVDGAHGDGGVRWAVEFMRFMEIPLNPGRVVNPDGDLVGEYWPSVRDLVKRKLR